MGDFGDDIKRLEQKAKEEGFELRAEDLIEKRALLTRSLDEATDQD